MFTFSKDLRILYLTMIRLQPKDMPDQEEENKKAHQSVVENMVFFFLTIAVIRAGEHQQSTRALLTKRSRLAVTVPIDDINQLG